MSKRRNTVRKPRTPKGDAMRPQTVDNVWAYITAVQLCREPQTVTVIAGEASTLRRVLDDAGVPYAEEDGCNYVRFLMYPADKRGDLQWLEGKWDDYPDEIDVDDE